jgi:predicted nuclease of predicted toxin-antitoxin system
MKFLVDMNLAPSWTDLLRQAGFSAIHWSSIGPLDATDVQIMAHAKDIDAIVLTYDLDFGAILAASGGSKPSVVQIRAANVSPKIIGSSVIAALFQMESELKSGALLTIETNRTRLRILPLRLN